MNDLLQYKLDILKVEIETINKAILDKDDASRQIKKWATTIWAGAVGLVGAAHILSPNIATTLWTVSTAFIPFSFMILDAFQKRGQRKFIWRARKIHSFFNDTDSAFNRSLERGDIVDFRIYDPGGENSRRAAGNEEESKQFEKFISVWGSVRKPSLFFLYVVLAIFSILLTTVGWVPVWVLSS